MNGDTKSGSVQLRNPHVANMEEDVLYHIALGTRSHDLKAMFHDVKFVCMGGSPNRMERFANYLVKELRVDIPAGLKVSNISAGSDRYAVYKVGPVMSVSHGMGIPSISIIFHELVKLMHHAGCTDVRFFRIGTCGGLGLEPGTVVLSEEACDGMLKGFLELATLGKRVQHPAFLDKDLVQEILACVEQSDDFQTVTGKTMCTYDFYEGQARLDGAFCSYTEKDKMDFLKSIHESGVVNIEMESLCFAALCHRAGIKGAVLCVTLLDRLRGDQVTTDHAIMEEWQTRPQRLVTRYIKKQLGLD